MSEAAVAPLPPEYRRWQGLLADEFFGDRAGRPVVMFVDAEDLRRLDPEAEDPVQSLVDAVTSFVDLAQGVSMFAAVLRAETAYRLRRPAAPPPTLPVLALSVLAATEMRTDPEGARHNYYVRLARALLPEGSQAELRALCLELSNRGAFADVADMWRRLHQWLTAQAGSHGVSTLPDNPRLTRIGYPLSQALIRRSDRAALTRFFDRMKLRWFDVPSAGALLDLLKIWTHGRSQGFSDRFIEVLDEPDMQEYLRPIIHELARTWDGKVITTEGLRRLEIRLALDPDRGRAWWVIPAVGDVVADTLTGSAAGSGFTMHLTPDRDSSMIKVQGMPPVTPQALAGGMTARGRHCVAELQPAPVFILTDSADAGGWAAVDAIQAFEEHIIVAAHATAPTVEHALRTAADPGWKRLNDRIASEIIAGYAIYYKVSFSDHDTLHEAMRLLPASFTANVQLGTTSRPRLVNGLPLHRLLSPNSYLAGGEPDLELPVGVEPRDVEVTLDGMTKQTFRASIKPLWLCRSGPYEAGEHSVQADGETLHFVVRIGSGLEFDPPGVGSISWKDGEMLAADSGHICGAWTPEADETPVVLVRRGAVETWLVDRTGQVTALADPPLPAFGADLSFMCFEVSRDKAVWVLQKRARGWQMTRLRAAEPAFRSLGPADHRVWSQAAASVRTTDKLWPLYCAAWERIRGR